MIVTSFCGFYQLKLKHMKDKNQFNLIDTNNNNNNNSFIKIKKYRSFIFWRNMFIIGVLR